MENSKLENLHTIRAPLFTLAAMLESAAVAAPKKEADRLAFVELVSDETGAIVKALATDSARMHCATWELKKEAEQSGLSFFASNKLKIYLSLKDVARIVAESKEAEKTSKKNGGPLPVAVIESDGKETTFKLEKGETVAASYSFNYAGPEVELEACMEKYEDAGAFVSFNAGFIGDLKKAGAALDSKAPETVTMHAPRNPFKPFTVELSSGLEFVSARALITPMRCYDAEADYKGFETLAKNGGDMAELRRENAYLSNLCDDMRKELQALRREKEAAPARAADAVTLESTKRAHDKALEDLTAAIREKEALQARANEYTEKYEAARATIEEKQSANIRLCNMIEELKKELEEAKAAAAAPVEKKDGGKEPATAKQCAYIAKLGGAVPDGATIRDASILITLLKKKGGTAATI